MALPKYLYSINPDSLQAPLLQEDQLDRSGQELATSADTEPGPGVTALAEDSDKFTGEVRLSGPNPSYYEHKSDVYTSARLAAAGIPDPMVEERQLHDLSADGVSNHGNGTESGEEFRPHSRYGTYDESPPLIRPQWRSRPPSSTSDGFVGYKNDTERTKHEDAALYVHEGEDNDKFNIHPRGVWSKRAYQILHSAPYHVINLCVCTTLLLLALIEHPSLATQADLPPDTQLALVAVHAIVEILLLGVVWVDLLLRFLWFRPRHFFFHKRTLLILVVLLVMSVEAIVVLARRDSHFRITRALRPIFILDTYLMGGVRRVLRQIFLCIKPILDVLVLLMLALVLFSLLGYLIFAEINTTYFVTLSRSLVSFFITMTTANHPNVWMEAYVREPASPLFFAVYIIVMVYFVSNVLLAVVYSSFSEADKRKFKKLFLHKRDALRHAYKVLINETGTGVEFHDFLLFMHYYRPRIPEWQVMCIFKALHKDPMEQHKELSLEEFYAFYEVRDLKWSRATEEGEEITWFERRDFHSVIKKPAKLAHTIVNSPWFNVIINIAVFCNLVFLVVYTLLITEEEVGDRYHALNRVVAVSLVFVSFYLLEICLRIFANEPLNHFRKPGHFIDFCIILTSFILLIVEATSPAYSVLAVFRPVKFVRLLRLKRRYRDIMDTLVVLSQRLFSVSILLVVVYYSFSIVGMEFFNSKVEQNCCNGSLYGVEEYYSGSNSTFTPNVYYLLNFDNILRSYVTLFVLMVVNNWYIVMEGFASTSENLSLSWLIRLYFMAFFIITLVVLQVVISFIVEAFVFRIHEVERKRQCHKHPNKRCNCHKAMERKKTVLIKLLDADVTKLKYEVTYNDEIGGESSFSRFIRHRRRVNLEVPKSEVLTYTGRRLRTKDDIQLLMYRSDLTHWIHERDKEVEQPHEVTPKRKPVLKTVGRYITSCVQYIIE